MMPNKHHTPLKIIFLLFAIILGAIFLVTKGDGVKAPIDNGNNNPPVVAQKAYKCGLTVDTPLPGSTVSFPLTITGTIHNAVATDNCTWTLFEGQAGTVSAALNNIMDVGFTPIVLSGDWMTSGPVPFSITFIPASPIATGTPVTLTFVEENPSGEGSPDALIYNVIAQ